MKERKVERRRKRKARRERRRMKGKHTKGSERKGKDAHDRRMKGSGTGKVKEVRKVEVRVN